MYQNESIMSPHIIVPVKKLHPDAVLPQYQTDGAAGMDLCAMNLGDGQDWPDGFNLRLYPRDQVLLGTGIGT